MDILRAIVTEFLNLMRRYWPDYFWCGVNLMKEYADKWDENWSIFVLMTLLRHSWDYLRVGLSQQKNYPVTSGKFNFRRPIHCYLNLVVRALSNDQSLVGKHFRTLLDLGWRDQDTLASVMETVLQIIASVDLVGWRSLLEFPISSSLPLLSTPAERMLSFLEIKELEAEYI